MPTYTCKPQNFAAIQFRQLMKTDKAIKLVKLQKYVPVHYFKVIHLPQRDGRVSWPRWLLHAEMVYSPTEVTHPSTNRSRRLVTFVDHEQHVNHYTTPPSCLVMDRRN